MSRITTFFINYAPGTIKLLKEAQAFPLLAGTGIKDHPKNVRTIFLVESGASNKLKAVLRVNYLGEFSSFSDLFGKAVRRFSLTTLVR